MVNRSSDTTVDRWAAEAEAFEADLPELDDHIARLCVLLDEIDATTFRTGELELVDVGFVLYLVSWTAVNRINPPTDLEGRAGALDQLVLRTARLYRTLPSPDLAAYGLLAIRAEALAYSKRGQFQTYLDSRLSFEDCRRRASRYLKDHPSPSDPVRHRLLEVIEQVDLAETGTSARVAEERLTQWADHDYGREASQLRAGAWRRLHDGIRHGESSIEALTRLREEGRLRAGDRSCEQISTFDWQFRPYQMTARCHLNAIPYCWLFEGSGGPVRPRFDARSWEHEANYHRRQTERLFGEMLLAPRRGASLKANALREIVQIRLHYALLFPGCSLPEDPSDAGFTEDLSIEGLSRSLCDNGNDANVISSISDPAIVDVIENRAPGYRAWLDEWCCLARPQSPRRRQCSGCNHRGAGPNE